MSQPSPVATLMLQLAIAYIYIYPLFSVATITKPAFPVAVATLSAQRSAVATCGMLFIYIYYFYFLFLFFCCNNYPACPFPACCNSHETRFSAQLLQLAVCLLSILNTFIYLFWLQQLLSLPSPACCNSHEALQHSLVLTGRCCNLPYAVYLYILFIFLFFCCNNY